MQQHQIRSDLRGTCSFIIIETDLIRKFDLEEKLRIVICGLFIRFKKVFFFYEKNKKKTKNLSKLTHRLSIENK